MESSVEGTCIDCIFQCLGGFKTRRFGAISGLEPAILFDLVVSDRGQRWLGPHHDHGLKLAFDFSDVSVDEKLANIKFRHVSRSLIGNGARRTRLHGPSRFFGEYGSS